MVGLVDGVAVTAVGTAAVTDVVCGVFVFGSIIILLLIAPKLELRLCLGGGSGIKALLFVVWDGLFWINNNYYKKF